MEFKVGDKVRFLNEKGGGIVTALISTTMVKVAIEEGFEVPVLAAELIKIEPAGAADRFFDRKINVPAPTQQQQTPATPAPVEKVPAKTEEDYEDSVKPLYRQSGAGIPEGIYINYTPHDQKFLLTGSLDIYLINNTPCEAIFSFMLEDENRTYSGVNYDVIPPYSKILIETITREDLELWTNGIVQVIFYKSELLDIYSPMHAHFKIKATRFYKETSYQDFPLVGSKAIVINLGDLASQKLEGGVLPDQKANIDPAAKQKVDAISPSAMIDKHRTGPREAEVDLHISALRSDYATMPQGEILLYQIDYFSKMLDNAIAYNYNRVIFIHGIGNGTLKSAIIDRLKDYENIELKRAPFAQYGYGAIEVAIHHGG